MALAAMAAVGLSVGGFELGASKIAQQPQVTTVNVPDDHPIAVALKTPVAQSMTPSERDQLAKLAINLKRDEEHAKSDALRETAQVVYSLQSPSRPLGVSVIEANEKVAKLEAKLAEKAKRFDSQSKEIQILRQKVTEARAHLAKQEGQRDYVDKAETYRVAVGQENRFIDLRRDVEKQLIQKKTDDVYQKYKVMALQQMTPKVSEKVKEVAAGRRDMNEEKGFGLLIALRDRDELKLTPQQVTKLQLLQADFIRRFAPLREAYETRVDNLKWRYPEAETKYLDLRVVPSLDRAKPEDIKREFFVETDAKGKEHGKSRVHFWIYSTTDQIAANQKKFQYKIVPDISNSKDSVVRYFVWSSDESLLGQLKSLKKEIDDKAKKLLSTPQRQLLQEKIDQSLATDK